LEEFLPDETRKSGQLAASTTYREVETKVSAQECLGMDESVASCVEDESKGACVACLQITTRYIKTSDSAPPRFVFT
jgi:hypothetical protein